MRSIQHSACHRNGYCNWSRRGLQSKYSLISGADRRPLHRSCWPVLEWALCVLGKRTMDAQLTRNSPCKAARWVVPCKHIRIFGARVPLFNEQEFVGERRFAF